MNKEENIPHRNNPQKDNSIKEYKDNAITDEADFYSFLDQCKNNKIFGIENQLQELNQYEISPEMRKKIVEYYKDDARNNQFDLEALEKFKKATDTAPLDEVQEALNEGPRSVMLWVLDHYHIVTKKEVGTDKEEMYVYNLGFYIRGEEILRSAIFQRYIDRWNDSLLTIKELWKTVDKGNPDKVKELAELTSTIGNLLKKGPSKAKIDETLAQIRLLTFREASEFNPPSHIPFRNGLLRLADWKLVPHTPDLIYLWRVEASLIENRLNNISLNDCPMYKKFLIDTYEPWDIPMLLQYGGYAFYPTFPRQKVLWNVGRPRVGKGTNARVWKNLNPTGYGAISFEKLMIAENRFAFQGIEGKNLLVDPEVKRNYKKGARPDYGNFNKLFGGDTVDLEEKNKKTTEYVSKAKGLFLANLPIPRIDDEPFLSRVLLVKSRDRIISNEERVANLDEKIVEAERDQIATLFVRYLKVLESRNWNFISELSTDATMEMWDMFSDAVQHYLEEMISFQEGAEIKCDDMYDSFAEWCKAKGVPVMKSQSFKKSVGYIYPKAKRGTKKSRYYVFMNCVFSDENEIEVGHQSNSQETRNIRASYYRYRWCPTSVPILNMRKEEENHDRIKIPKLDTELFDSPDAKNKASHENKMVSNLIQDPDEPFDDSSSESQSDPTKPDVPKQNPLHAMVMDILTRLSSSTGKSRIDPQEIIDAWPSTASIPCPGWNEMSSRILPTMAGEGLLHISNGMVEVSS